MMFIKKKILSYLPHLQCYLLSYIKIVCFVNGISSIHQPIFCIFKFTNSTSNLVISIGIAWKYLLQMKQIFSNCFLFLLLEWVVVGLDLPLNKDASDGSDIDAAAPSVPVLSASLSFLSLLINECLANAEQHFPLRLCLQKVVFLTPISSWTYVYL